MRAVYVAVTGEDRIATYERSAGGGSGGPGVAGVGGGGEGLRHRLDTPCPSPFALTLDPARRLLFAATQGTAELLSFAVEPGSGALRQLSAVPTAQSHARASEDEDADFACYLATDRTGRWLFSAHHWTGSCAVHEILPDGTLSPAPHQHEATTSGCHCIQTTHDNRYCFVPCAGFSPGDAETVGNRIFMYTFDEDTGRLTRNGDLRPPTPASARFVPREPAGVPRQGGDGQWRKGSGAVAEGRTGTVRDPVVVPVTHNRFGNRHEVGPRHFALHPTLPMLYTTDEQANTVTAYVIRRDGSLSAMQSEEMLPLSFREDSGAG